VSSNTQYWRVVAEREMTTRLRDKAFLGATAFTVVLLVGIFVVTTLLGGRADEHDVAVTSAADEQVAAAAEGILRATGSAGAEIDVRRVADRARAEQLVRDGDADAALLSSGDGYMLVGDEEIDDALGAALTQAATARAVQDNADAQGVDLDALHQGAQVDRRLLDPNASESDARSAVAFAFALVFLMTAIGFGMTIASSITQEKESRVVEILAAAIPVRALLWGKIAGNTVLALGQVVMFSLVGVAGMALTGHAELLAGVSWAVVWYVAFFVLGFVALAALWSVAGSLASRQQDLQSTTLPGQLLLFVPYFVSIFANEEVKQVFSMLPIVSTMIMPGRMAEGSVPWWQVAVAIVLTVAAAAVFVRVGSRLFEKTLLRTGTKLGYREAFRLSA
jgi:ABC-2 type transport system permease protein